MIVFAATMIKSWSYSTDFDINDCHLDSSARNNFLLYFTERVQQFSLAEWTLLMIPDQRACPDKMGSIILLRRKNLDAKLAYAQRLTQNLL